MAPAKIQHLVVGSVPGPPVARTSTPASSPARLTREVPPGGMGKGRTDGPGSRRRGHPHRVRWTGRRIERHPGDWAISPRRCGTLPAFRTESDPSVPPRIGGASTVTARLPPGSEAAHSVTLAAKEVPWGASPSMASEGSDAYC